MSRNTQRFPTSFQRCTVFLALNLSLRVFLQTNLVSWRLWHCSGLSGIEQMQRILLTMSLPHFHLIFLSFMPVLQIEFSTQRNEAKHRLSDWLRVTHRKCNWAKYWIFICGFVFQHFTIRSSFKFSFKWEEKKAEEFQTFSSYQSFTYFQAWENNLWKTIQIGRHIFRNWYLMSKLWLTANIWYRLLPSRVRFWSQSIPEEVWHCLTVCQLQFVALLHFSGLRKANQW